ncbi:MAG: energy transducer TonB [Pseudomonadota bacterium]
MSFANRPGSLTITGTSTLRWFSYAAVALCLGLFLQRADAQTARALPEIISLTEAELSTDLGQRYQALQSAFRANLGNTDYSGALQLAKDLVPLGIELWGQDDPRNSLALTNLAIVQAEQAEFGAAQLNFEAAIRLREEAQDSSIIAPELINPIRGLASTRMALNDIEAAIPLYERAIHISHVNEGPNNLSQVEVMDALARAHLALGDVSEANDIQDNMYRLQQRRFSDDSDQYVDAMLRRARWYAAVGEFSEASNAYKRASRRLTAVHGKEDIRLIQPLVELAFASSMKSTDEPDLMNDIQFSDGRRAMNSAVRIARVNADTDPRLLPSTLAKQGDYLSITADSRLSRARYREAWELLSTGDPELLEFRDELFGEPVSIAREVIRPQYEKNANNPSGIDRTAADRGFVELTYDVSPRGRTTNIRIVDSEPPGLMDRYVARKVRRFAYRPALQDGRPVIYRGLRWRHDFRYRASRLDQGERDLIETARAARESQRAEQAAADPAVAGDSTGENDVLVEDIEDKPAQPQDNIDTQVPPLAPEAMQDTQAPTQSDQTASPPQTSELGPPASDGSVVVDDDDDT